MLTYNDQTKARFPLSLDGRGARGEGALAAAVAVAALLFAPQAAQAQCAPTPTGTETIPASASGTVTCQPGDYANGIHYNATGDLTLVIPDGADQLNVFDDGISVTGTLGDSVVFDSSDLTSENIRGTDDAVIDYSSDTGNIDIQTGGRIFASGTVIDVIRANATGDGNIDITTGGSVSSSSLNADNTIEATTAGGNIVITTLDAVNISSSTSPPGDSNGIRAQTSGDGTITLSVQHWVSGGGDGTGIHAIAGDGDIDIDVRGIVNSRAVGFGGGAQAAIGIHTQTTGTAFIDLRESLSGADTSIYGTEAAILAEGGNVIVEVSGTEKELSDSTAIRGALDFSALTGHAEVNIRDNGAWLLADTQDPQSVFSDGDDVVSVDAGGTTYMTTFCTFCTNLDETSIVNFGAGSDTFANAGTLIIAPFEGTGFDGSLPNDRRRAYEGRLQFDNLETFVNSGTIYLGLVFNQDFEIVGTDGVFDDILSMPGTDFVGSGDSRIFLDISLGRAGGAGGSCDDSARDSDGDLPMSDCIDLSGGTASGRTEIVFNTLIPGDRGALNPEGALIVDLAGGSAEPDAFVISPDSAFYSPQFGGVIDKGLFFFPLAYDAENQQFRLYGQPSSVGQQIPIMGNIANDLWRTATRGWFGRQVDQREVEKESGFGGGVWARVTASDAERDVITPIVAGIETFNFDNSYTQDDSALTMGVDLISRSDGNMAWVFGPMLGYARSRVDFDATPNTANLEGSHFGLYSSLTFGDFYVDAVVNGVWLEMDYDAPALNLFPEGTLLGTDIESLGAQVEAGWGGLKFWRLGIEPLASLSYVKTNVEDVNVPAADPSRFGGNFEFQDPESLRAGLGLRLSLTDVLPGFAPTDLGLTARVMNESEGDSTATIISTGPIPVDQTDTFDGTFTEIVGSVSISNAARTMTGFLNVDGTFESDYERVGVEAGFRYQW